MNATDTDFAALADAISAQGFDHAFQIVDGKVIDAPDLGRTTWVPDVSHDETDDVRIDGDDWSALTGMTGQYGYSGAAMHVSETVGAGMARVMAEISADAPHVFAMVEIREEDGDFPEGDPIGWAMVYRTI
jgi:hypothetical protein